MFQTRRRPGELDKKLDKMKVGSTAASDSSVASDDTSNQEYKDYALSMAPAGYASIPKADRDVVFASKLLCMLDAVHEDGLDYIIGWQPHGRCFIVRDHRLILQILVKYLKISKWATFHRQLYVYGFKRITQGPDKGAYYHEKFLRGRSFLAAQMTRVQTKGLRGRKKLTEEPNFWAMPWVKPIESTPETIHKNGALFPEKQLQQRNIQRIDSSMSKQSSANQELSKTMEDRLALQQNRNNQLFATSLQSSNPQLLYLHETSRSNHRYEEPFFLRQVVSSASPDRQALRFVHHQQQPQEVHYAPGPSPVMTSQLGYETAATIMAGRSGHMVPYNSRLPMQLAPDSGFFQSRIINGSLSDFQTSTNSRIIHSSNVSNALLKDRLYGSSMLQDDQNSFLRSSQGMLSTNQHHVTQQQQQQQNWFDDRVSQNNANISTLGNYQFRGESIYHSPTRTMTPPAALAARTENVLTPVVNTMKGDQFVRRVPSVTPPITSNDTEHQVAEGLLMLGSN